MSILTNICILKNMQKQYIFKGQYVMIDMVINMKKYEQIYFKFRNDIINGYLKKNQTLPSIRESCELFKASQTTIEHAYNQLVTEGYITSIPQIGYYVSIEEERINLHKQIDKFKTKDQPIHYRYDFRSQTVSQDSFEISTWKRYLKDVLDDINNMATYGDSQGEYVLREALCQYAYKIRGVLSQPDRILIGSNYQSLLFILCSLFHKNITIAMEQQEDSQAKRVFESYGYQVKIIDSDEEGINIENLKKYDIDVLYINSASGGKKKKPINNRLRDEIIEYTALNDILIIEDDYNGELTYHSKHHHAMQGFSVADNIIYCGSFSRLLLPSFRISYLVLNKKYDDIYKSHKSQYGPTASKLEQLAFSKYIIDGYLEKHLRKLKKEYREKNKKMYKAIKKYISFHAYLNEAYLSYYVELKDIDEKRFIDECQKQKIAVNNIKNHILKISFASIPINQIDEAIKQLSLILQNVRI